MAEASGILPCLWYSEKGEEAAEFYAATLPNSRVDAVTALPAETPHGPEGAVKVVEFTLVGQKVLALCAPGPDRFNHAISLMVECDDQAEIDRLWDTLSEGGHTENCGWLQDRYGVYWQIVPRRMIEMFKDPDRAAARRVAEAMMRMDRLDIAELRRALAGG